MRNCSSLINLLIGTSLALSLSACESGGAIRTASAGAKVPSKTASKDSGSGTSKGSSGSGTASSGSGSRSASNRSGLDSSGSGDSGFGSASGLASSGRSSGVGVIPVGLVGSNGVGGSGAAKNTGKRTKNGAASPLLVTAGNAVLTTADRGDGARSTTNKAAPNSKRFTGTVTKTLRSTGQALVRSGDGSTYLVDGVTAAPGSAVTVGAGKGTLVGSKGSDPLFGVNVVSATQNSGSLATLGAGNKGALANAMTPQGGVSTASLASGSNGLINGSANGSQVIGNGKSAAVGVTALQSSQGSSGSVLTAGAATGSNAATVNGTSVASPLGATSGSVTTTVNNAVNTVTSATSGSSSTNVGPVHLGGH